MASIRLSIFFVTFFFSFSLVAIKDFRCLCFLESLLLEFLTRVVKVCLSRDNCGSRNLMVEELPKHRSRRSHEH
jgi:hypothetical protein